MVYRNGEVITVSANSNSAASQEIYSTEERVIGTWIDGRPLYVRTWLLKSPTMSNSYTWYQTGVVIDNLDELADYNCMIKSNGNDVFIKTPYYESLNTYFLVTYWTGYDGMYGFFTYQNDNNSNIFKGCLLKITAKYTKTTDESTIELEDSQYLQSIADMSTSYSMPVTSGGIAYSEEFNNE